ncbi:SGK3 kinase, partial [Polypterus senegalus]
MDSQNNCPHVRIPCHNEQRDKKKRFTVYKVIVAVGRHEWFVFRRYAEFDKLYNTLRKQFPTMNLKLPAKRIFGDNFDPEFIQQRRAGLNEFIQRIVSHPQLSNQDLKPENILLDSEYLAPEVLRKQPYDNTVDWWCLGSVLYEMLYGLPPFYSRDTSEMYENILHKHLAIRPGATPAAWDLLESLLEKDRTKRLGSKEDFDGPDDIRNFDPEFTDEMVPHSVCCSSERSIVNASVLEADDAFVGFSYAPPSEDSFL